ncbi:hypothetical protein IV203_029105 [Nitzschia inconspicua]|uniref:Uncharacterized protein n=1 Tax=Nitzschia inconspicua TaxID=303405 RepID=A0A9K3LQV7_9STRA|nr:hypothetical protein IV203_029105 [Nitzschia inconspicua]
MLGLQPETTHASGGMLGVSSEHPTTKRSRSAGNQGSTMKRVKLFNEIPPVQNGVISASKTPVIDEGRIVDIPTEKVLDVGYFFDDDVKDIPEYDVSQSVQNALKSTCQKEKALRNAVYTDLMFNHNIKFPESSFKPESTSRVSKLLRRVPLARNKEYVEADLAKLLAEYAKVCDPITSANHTTSVQRIVRGLPVTTTSEPELAPIDTRGPAQIRLGGFKNASNYNVAKAKIECTMYLLGLLYWLRVELGRPVESVFGFYFCGCRCEDQKKKTYTVGILKLSASQYLGDEMKAVCYEIKDDVNSLLPMRLLIHFLKEGKRWDISNQTTTVPVERRIPSLFTLPSNLWNDEHDARRLVLHGTLSIVFDISSLGLENLLMCENPVHFKNSLTDKQWTDFCSQVSSLSKSNGSTADTRFFLKIRSKDTSSQRRPMGAMWDVWDLLVTEDRANDDHQVAVDSISRTYPLRPYTTENIGVILMRDRGCPLKLVSSFPDPKSIVTEFRKVMKTASFLSTCLPHGDVLPHNLVYDQASGEMTLIDVDEGVRKPQISSAADHILRRKNAYSNDSNDWYIALLYPNVFREYAESYTKLQLIASFLYLITRIDKLTSTSLKHYELIHDKAESLGVDLCLLDKEDSMLDRTNTTRYIASVDDLYKDMEKLVDAIIAA